METKANLAEYMKEYKNSIHSYGFKVIWRNSFNYRYLRIIVDFGKKRLTKDFFYKQKVLGK